MLDPGQPATLRFIWTAYTLLHRTCWNSRHASLADRALLLLRSFVRRSLGLCPGQAGRRRVDPALQRQGPRRLDAEDSLLRAGRQLRQHVSRRGRRAEGRVRQVRQVRRALRPPVLQGAVLELHPAGRVSLRRRAMPGRAGLGDSQQRRHAPRRVARRRWARTRIFPRRSRCSSSAARAAARGRRPTSARRARTS